MVTQDLDPSIVFCWPYAGKCLQHSSQSTVNRLQKIGGLLGRIAWQRDDAEVRCDRRPRCTAQRRLDRLAHAGAASDEARTTLGPC